MEGGVAEVDLHHVPLETRHADPVSPLEGAVKKDHEAGQQVGEDVPEGEPQGETGQPQAGDQGGHVDVQGPQNGDPGEGPQGDADGLIEQQIHVPLTGVGTGADPAEKAAAHAGEDHEKEQERRAVDQAGEVGRPLPLKLRQK